MKFTVKHLDSRGKFVHRALPIDSTLWRPVSVCWCLVVFGGAGGGCGGCVQCMERAKRNLLFCF